MPESIWTTMYSKKSAKIIGSVFLLLAPLSQLLCSDLVSSAKMLAAVSTLVIIYLVMYLRYGTFSRDYHRFLVYAVIVYLFDSYALLLYYISSPAYLDLVFIGEAIAMTTISFYALNDALEFEKRYNSNGLNANLLMIYGACIALSCIIFSQQLINGLTSYNSKEWRCIFTVYLTMWLFISSCTLLSISKEDLKLNTLRTAMAFLFMASNLLLFLSLQTKIEEQSITLEIMSRAALMGVVGVILLFISTPIVHRNTSKNIQYAHYSLYIGVICLCLVLPTTAYIHFYTSIRIDFDLFLAVSTICIILLSLRLLFLFRASQFEARKYHLESRKDFITQLPNRIGMVEAIDRSNTRPDFIAMLDLADFQAVNDLYGNGIGDQLLMNFGGHIQKIMDKRFGSQRHQPIVARMISDEFALVIFDLEKLTPTELVDYVLSETPEWWQVGPHRIFMTCRIGYSTERKISLNERLRQAEFSVQEAGKNRSSHSPETMLNFNLLGNRQKIRQYVHESIENNRVVIQLQPIFSLSTDTISGFEVLVRLSVDGQMLYPGAFLDIIDQDGLHGQLLHAIVYKVSLIRQLNPHKRINLNIPPILLNQPNAADKILDVVHKYHLSPNNITLEMIESAEIERDLFVLQAKQLSAYGFKLALDDFGTGYSSISRVSALPIDYIKIDRSLVVLASSGDLSPIESAIVLAKSRQSMTVAEGVETFKQLEIMRRLGIDYVQGFLTGKPLDPEDAIALQDDIGIEEAMKTSAFAVQNSGNFFIASS